MVIICHINVRSLVAPARLTQLKEICSQHSIDALCLSETWLKPKHLSSTLLLPDFQPPFRLDRPAGRGGGIAIYVRHGLAAEALTLPPSSMECAAVRITLPKRKKIVLFCAYRPPHTDSDTFLDALEHAITPYVSSNLCLVGDFNAKHSAWFNGQHTDSHGTALKQFSDGLNLQQLIHESTYNITSDNPSLLDLIFTNRPEFVRSSFVLPPPADHCPVLTSLSIKKNKNSKPFYSERPLYHQADVQSLLDELSSLTQTCQNVHNLDDRVSLWTTSLHSAFTNHIPHQLIRVQPSSKPWYNSYLRYLGKLRDRLFHRSRNKPSNSPVMSAFRKIRNLYVAELRAAEKRHFLALGASLLTNKLNSHQWWKRAKKACGWSSPRSIPPLSTEDTLAISSQEKADCLNSRFSHQCSTSSPANFPDQDVPSPYPLFSLAEISLHDVWKVMSNLHSGKSAGPDNIPNEVLKLTCSVSAESLCLLINESFTTNKFPEAWKQSIICPVLKPGKKPTDPASYRPIALLNTSSKITEKFVHRQLLQHCLQHGILPDEQFGFLPGRSAEWQLLSTLEDWHCALDRKNHVHCVLLDAAKAFDRVDHTCLLHCLASIGLSSDALQWFCSYLSGRSIRTRVNGCLSSPRPVTSGVPQGSVLGPLLFLLYYKDIPSICSAATALFADDTMLYQSSCQGSSSTPCCALGNDLDALTLWAESRNVTFNALKSVDFRLGPHPASTSLLLCESPIPQLQETRHLGILLRSDLRWNSHLSDILTRCAPSIVLCQSLAYRHHIPPSVIRRFYYAFIRPKLEYCSAVWCGASPSILCRLEKAQIKIAKCIARNNHQHNQHPTLLAAADLPTLTWRRREHCLVLLWSLTNGNGTPALMDMLSSPASIRSTMASRSSHALRFPRASTSRHLSSFLCYTIPLWNHLPSCIVNSKTKSSFCSALRSHFSPDKFTLGL